MKNIGKFLWGRYSAFPLALGTDQAIPGMLLEARWFLSRPRRLIREDGLVWELLNLPKGKYASRIAKANIIQESVDDEMSFKGSLSLAPFGLSLESALERKSSAKMKITGIKARVFKDTASAYDLMQKLLALKKKDRKMWRWVNDDFLIVESYYVTSFSIQFQRSGNRDFKAEFKKAGLKAEGKTQLNWKGDSQLEMVGTPAVPIAVRGLRV